MRILYVVQRYGDQIAGGAEVACRSLAEHMAARGHDVHVLTSCALSYADWADHFAPGVSDLNGVTVHRLSIRAPRSTHEFAPLMSRVLDGAGWPVQRDWLRVFGPELDVAGWIDQQPSRFDIADVFTYLYATASIGLRPIRARVPTVLHSTAHDESMFWVPAFDEMFDSADAAICLTPEEAALVERRTSGRLRTHVVGLGLDDVVSGDGDRFRAQFDLGAAPYVLYVGRLDPGKGAHELHGFMTTMRVLGRTDANLVMLGEPQGAVPIAASPGVILPGFVDAQTRDDAIAGCTVLVQPSYFESFSLSLCEAWLHERPAMVQDSSTVLLGQAVRSGGALRYRGLAQFDAGLSRLLEDSHLRSSLGQAGRSYVLREYGWESVLDQYERAIEEVVLRRGREDQRVSPVRRGTVPLRSSATR